ncbi:hypothetical protein M8C13_30745 [Crossiella sp. SN42]|uniref:HAAS signaling domain-containing protein n=1 Tax=Crossiella sp. SN42 TaxID=2944808 RepID=UPI00207D3C98|nr:hypothetical protein [Crossiella sp. SN42]MCO1580142.1 hypothetical protein [Crossiella sp. SN42]
MSAHPLATAWLRGFDRAARGLSRQRRAELRAELAEHLRQAMAGSVAEAEAQAAVDRLGDPADIVAEEGPADPAEARRLAARALTLQPLSGPLYLLPGHIGLFGLAALAVLVLAMVLRTRELPPGARALGVLGALAPPTCGYAAYLAGWAATGEQGYGPVAGGLWIEVVPDPAITVLGHGVLLLAGLGLPLLAGWRLRRADQEPPAGFTLALLVLALTPVSGSTIALLWSSSGVVRFSHLEPFTSAVLVCAALNGLALLTAGVLLLRARVLGALAGLLVACAVVTAPLGVVLLSGHRGELVERGRGTGQHVSHGLVQDSELPAAVRPLPWLPLDQPVRFALGVLTVIVLPLAAAYRVHHVRAVLGGEGPGSAGGGVRRGGRDRWAGQRS